MAQIGQWDMGPQMGQWTPMDSPTRPMVQWDRTDSGIWGPQMGQWTPWTVPPVPWYSGIG